MSDFHWLRLDMTAGYGRERPWSVGETRSLPDTVEIKLCKRGYHSAPTLFDGLPYAPGPMACMVEVSEPVERDATKQVSRSRTLLAAVDVSRELRLWAADCAERSLHAYESRYPGDMRPRNAIAVARAFTNGKATLKALRAAYNDAVDAADNADNAAYHAAIAAYNAASHIYTANTARNAAYNAAYAANAAAKAAANDAASAAYYAASAAYYTAYYTAYYAAYAANDAADAAANAANERAWQRARFDEIVLPVLMAAVTT